MPTSYEHLVQRVQRVIGSSGAQSKHRTEIQRQPDESAADWAHMLGELGTVENVTMTPLDAIGEHVRIEWNPEESMA